MQEREQKLIVAGFGGQGVLLVGRLLAYAGMIEDKKVTWIPSYGPEMRGGTANCTVVLSDKEIGSPIAPVPDSVIVMNQPSLDKFEPMLKETGLLIANSNMLTRKQTRKDLNIVEIPVNGIASELGDERVANMVALGAYIEKTHIVKMESISKALKNMLPGRYQNLIPLNEKALEMGAKFTKENGGEKC